MQIISSFISFSEGCFDYTHDLLIDYYLHKLNTNRVQSNSTANRSFQHTDCSLHLCIRKPDTFFCLFSADFAGSKVEYEVRIILPESRRL